jgi:undecaprenyl-diphosphatase
MRIPGERIANVWRANASMLTSVVVIGGLLLVFWLIADEVLEGEPSAFDRNVLLAFRAAGNPSDPIGPPWLQEAARDVTALGSVAFLTMVLLAVVGYLLLTGKRAAAWLVLVAVVGGVTLNTLLKLGFARPRPDFVAPAARVLTPSFPSGHAALSAVTYLTLGALLARLHQGIHIRIYFMAIGVVLALMVGLSRIYLGVHYPTDVIAGWCIGSAWAWACWALMSRLQQEGQVEPPDRS